MSTIDDRGGQIYNAYTQSPAFAEIRNAQMWAATTPGPTVAVTNGYGAYDPRRVDTATAPGAAAANKTNILMLGRLEVQQASGGRISVAEVKQTLDAFVRSPGASKSENRATLTYALEKLNFTPAARELASAAIKDVDLWK